MLIEQLIDIADNKCKGVADAYNGKSQDPLANWLVQLIVASHKPDATDFEQLTRTGITTCSRRSSKPPTSPPTVPPKATPGQSNKHN